MIILCLVLRGIACAYARKSISPYEYGLSEKTSPIENYWILYKTHSEAVKTNSPVSYKGVKTLYIEIPENAESIPLSDHTNFCNVKFHVKNTVKDVFLFRMSRDEKKISISKNQIDKGNFNGIEEMSKGISLLTVTDRNLWVKKRVKRNNGHYRSDLFVVKNGVANNLPISSYNNDATNISAVFCPVTKKLKTFINLRMYREEGSSKITNLLFLENQYNVKISNVEVTTPEDSLVNDRVFCIKNSSKIFFCNININRTYSRKDHSGYGVYMKNVYDIRFNRLTAHGNWGVFGTVYVNNIRLKNCDINRFDIHCYGRDVTFSKCIFRNLWNSFTSVMGTVSFNNCKFINFVPFAFRGDYNAFTHFNLSFRRCKFFINNKRHSLIASRPIIDHPQSERYELATKGWPDVTINKLTIVRDSSYSGPIYLFDFGHSPNKKLLKEIPSKIVTRGIKGKLQSSDGILQLHN